MEYLGYLFALFIGLILGLMGGGGSILTLPVLVYLFQLDMEIATSYSLFIVGISSMVGAYSHYILGNLKIKSAVIFAFPSIISLLLVRKIILPNIPQILFTINMFSFSKNLFLIIVFAILMIIASLSMIKKTETNERIKAPNYKILVLFGFSVGLITGFLGAGGGFLIIPALLFFAKLPMKQAVGTSLFIIFINASIGFTGDILSGIKINYQLLFTISGIAIVGMLLGTSLSKKIDGDKLKPFFGWFVLLMSIFIITKELFFNK